MCKVTMRPRTSLYHSMRPSKKYFSLCVIACYVNLTSFLYIKIKYVHLFASARWASVTEFQPHEPNQVIWVWGRAHYIDYMKRHPYVRRPNGRIEFVSIQATICLLYKCCSMAFRIVKTIMALLLHSSRAVAGARWRHDMRVTAILRVFGWFRY